MPPVLLFEPFIMPGCWLMQCLDHSCLYSLVGAFVVSAGYSIWIVANRILGCLLAGRFAEFVLLFREHFPFFLMFFPVQRSLFLWLIVFCSNKHVVLLIWLVACSREHVPLNKLICTCLYILTCWFQLCFTFDLYNFLHFIK